MDTILERFGEFSTNFRFRDAPDGIARDLSRTPDAVAVNSTIK